jgi:hypothetical protein
VTNAKTIWLAPQKSGGKSDACLFMCPVLFVKEYSSIVNLIVMINLFTVWLLDERSRPPKKNLYGCAHDEMRFTNRKEAESSAFI